MAKTVFLTGGAGYIGSTLVGQLLARECKVRVLDRLFFGTQSIEKYLGHPSFSLIQDDVRHFDEKHLKGVDVVMDLAGLANDPSCDLDPEATMSINHQGPVRVATLAKKMGVPRYIFSSSCSIYGHGQSKQLTESSVTSPVSAYARAKLAAEQDTLALADDNFCVTFLRNATVYGLSPRMRFDLVVNMMTMYAWKMRKIHILGGGKQWRPVVHVKDVGRAFIQVMEADQTKVSGEAFNVGAAEQNYQVFQIANMVRDIIPYVQVETVPDDADKRTYNVSFEKIKKRLGYRVERTVHERIVEIKQALENGLIDPEDTRAFTVKYYRYSPGCGEDPQRSPLSRAHLLSGNYECTFLPA